MIDHSLSISVHPSEQSWTSGITEASNWCALSDFSVGVNFNRMIFTWSLIAGRIQWMCSQWHFSVGVGFNQWFRVSLTASTIQWKCSQWYQFCCWLPTQGLIDDRIQCMCSQWHQCWCRLQAMIPSWSLMAGRSQCQCRLLEGFHQ